MRLRRRLRRFLLRLATPTRPSRLPGDELEELLAAFQRPYNAVGGELLRRSIAEHQ